MLEDSDSDDSLLGYNALPARRKRSETKKIAKGFAVMEDAMSHAEKVFEHDELMQKIKQESKYQDGDEENEALRKKNEEIIADFKKPKVETTTQDRDAIWEDLENVLTRERRIDLGKATEMDLTSPLGVRKTILFEPERSSKLESSERQSSYFDKQTSVAPYITQLKACLRRHVSHKNKTLQTALIQPLRKASTAKSSVGSKYLELKMMLEQKTLAKQRHYHNLREVPPDILQWLLRVACSPECTGVNIRHGAFQTLLALLRQNQFFTKQAEEAKEEEKNDTKENDTNDDEKFDDMAAPNKPSFLCLSQMVKQLQSWIPQSTGDETAGPRTGDASSSKNDEKDQAEMEIDKCNILGLERLLTIWITALECDQVSARSEGGAEDAKICMILLAKTLIDAAVQNPTR